MDDPELLSLTTSINGAFSLICKQHAQLSATMIVVSALLHRLGADPELRESLQVAIESAIGLQLNTAKISDQTISDFRDGMRAILPAQMRHLAD
jgi:hypothetical protein